MWLRTNGCRIKTRLINWFYALSRGRQIGVSTIAAHFLFLLFLTAQHWITSPSLKKRRPIAVNTVRLAAVTSPIPAPNVVAKTQAVVKTTKPVAIAKAAAPLKPVSSKTLKPSAAKKVETKKVEVKKGVATNSEGKKVAQKKGATPQQAALFAEIQHNLSAIEAPPTSKKATLDVPTLAPNDGVEAERSASPAEQISTFLQESLRLPEIGQVRVRVTIDRMGKLLTMEVLNSKSMKNAEFLKKQLPDLQFPCLNETVSLTIVFSNEL